jgi:UDP-N-acetylmuramoylalanine--D-glutamate ligase
VSAMYSDETDFKGKRVTVIGAAREGTALARFLAETGAKVTLTDVKTQDALPHLESIRDLSVRLVLGGHPDSILEADTIFVSPGVPLELPVLDEARRRGIPLSSETRLFFRLCPAPIIGITGSSGKTTTTAMVGEMLRASGHRTFVGGNIGQPLIGSLRQIARDDKVVVELSSFQLEMLGASPHIAAVLNITPNHLDRHPDMESYIAAKREIIAHQSSSDVAVLGYDDPAARGLELACRGAVAFFSRVDEVGSGTFMRDGTLVLRIGEHSQAICHRSELKLRGAHNLENALAAATVAGFAGATVGAVADVCRTFTGVAHRLEHVRTVAGAAYYDDSIATTPERASAALRSFDEPIVLLAGGRDKHLPWDELADLMLQKVRHLILFGEAANLIGHAVSEAVARSAGASELRDIESVATLEQAVAAAARVAEPGDVVLLSPGGTSFDAFTDFEERGKRFKKLVRNLQSGSSATEQKDLADDRQAETAGQTE